MLQSPSARNWRRCYLCHPKATANFRASPSAPCSPTRRKLPNSNENRICESRGSQHRERRDQHEDADLGRGGADDDDHVGLLLGSWPEPDVGVSSPRQPHLLGESAGREGGTIESDGVISVVIGIDVGRAPISAMRELFAVFQIALCSRQSNASLIARFPKLRNKNKHRGEFMVFPLWAIECPVLPEIVAFPFGFRKGNYPDNVIPTERSD
jgi:hypothetical protein